MLAIRFRGKIDWWDDKDMSNLVQVKEETYAIDHLKNISISFISSDVSLTFTEASDIKVIQYGKKDLDSKYFFEATHTDSSLNILQSRKTRNFCFLFCFFPQNRIEVQIPKAYQNTLKVKTTSGDIELTSISLEELDLHSTSGDIIVNGVIESPKINIETVSGEIEVDSIQTKEGYVKTVSGDIKANRLVADTIKTTTVSGDVDFAVLEGSVSLSTTSGDVDLERFLLQGDSNIHTVSGDVKVSLQEGSSCELKLKSVSGDKKLPNDSAIVADAKYVFSIKTTSGDITVYKK